MALLAVYKPDLLYRDGTFHGDLALAVGEDGKVERWVPAAEASGAIPLPGRAMLPGLVNAHSHAFQRLLRGRTEYVAAGKPDDTFWSWRERMYQAATALGPEDVYLASRQAFLEMALAGITTVGEFHYLHHQVDGSPYAQPHSLALQVVRAAREVGLRIVLLRVAYARAGFNAAENPRQRRFLDKSPESSIAAVSALASETHRDPAVTVGLAPHSVRALPREWLVAFNAYPGLVHMHVAEQPGEVEACLAEHGKRPVEFLSELGLLKERFTAVHAIHLVPSEMSLLGVSGASVCACPSTEQNLGDGVIAAELLAASGATLCLGSDSQASIDLLDEARALDGNLRLVRQKRAVLDPRQGAMDGLAQRLFAAATRGGARALGVPVGELAPGKPADFFTVDLNHPALAGAQGTALLPALLSGGGSRWVRDVAVDGKVLVRDGVHPLAETSSREFSALAKRVFA